MNKDSTYIQIADQSENQQLPHKLIKRAFKNVCETRYYIGVTIKFLMFISVLNSALLLLFILKSV